MAEDKNKKVAKKTPVTDDTVNVSRKTKATTVKKSVVKKTALKDKKVTITDSVEKKKVPRKRVEKKLVETVSNITSELKDDQFEAPASKVAPEPDIAPIPKLESDAELIVEPTPAQTQPSVIESDTNLEQQQVEPLADAPILTADDLNLEPGNDNNQLIVQNPVPPEVPAQVTVEPQIEPVEVVSESTELIQPPAIENEGEQQQPEPESTTNEQNTTVTTHSEEPVEQTATTSPDVPQLYREVPSYESSPMTYSFVSPFATVSKPQEQVQQQNENITTPTTAADEAIPVEVVDGVPFSMPNVVEPQVNVENANVNVENISKKNFGTSLLTGLVSFGSALKSNFAKLTTQIKENIRPGQIAPILGCFGLVILVYLLFVFGIFSSGYNFVKNLFVTKTPPVAVVHVDEKLLNAVGISGNYLFAHNQGSKNDRFLAYLQNSFYFGALGEMMFNGQTGIDTAIFYGGLNDIKVQTNLFIQYIQDLSFMQNLYKVDVYQMLDQTTKRDEKLQSYFDQLNFYSKRATDNIAQIGAMIDDLKIAYSSLSPDRAAAEKDFFVALDSFAGEKADFLLKSFTDASQKQVALKARLDAMQAVLKYTTSLKQYLDVRIKAVDQNRSALVQGIKVVDIPGANLNIIIKPGT